MAPTRQRELDHTDEGYICPERSTVHHQVGINDLYDVCKYRHAARVSHISLHCSFDVS